MMRFPALLNAYLYDEPYGKIRRMVSIPVRDDEEMGEEMSKLRRGRQFGLDGNRGDILASAPRDLKRKHMGHHVYEVTCVLRG